MGLGFEHVVTTALGLVGSLTMAIGGGLVLALGAAGVAAVGMGSDMAVMKSTIADTQTMYKGLEAVRLAIIKYGAGSAQAASAQADLNAQIAMLGQGAGTAAELALAKSVQALNIYWDKATQGARVAAVGILQQFVGVGNAYIPLVASAAQRNFGIIGDAIKPLMAWLAGPEGMGIFTDLENHFANKLPTSMHAMTQGVELLLKSIDFLATGSGGLTRTIDELLTKANSPAGFKAWEGHLTSMISVFHTWQAFFKILTEDIYQFFHMSVGVGTGIVQSLTDMLTKLHAWLLLTSTQSSGKSLFAQHKQEVLDLLALLPPLLTGFGSVYLAIAPAVLTVFVPFLDVVTHLLTAITSNAWGAWLVGITLIVAKFGLLAGLIGTISKGVGLTGLLSNVPGLGGLSSGTKQNGLASTVLDSTKGVNVFVTNWEMIRSGGLPGTPSVPSMPEVPIPPVIPPLVNPILPGATEGALAFTMGDVAASAAIIGIPLAIAIMNSPKTNAAIDAIIAARKPITGNTVINPDGSSGGNAPSFSNPFGTKPSPSDLTGGVGSTSLSDVVPTDALAQIAKDNKAAALYAGNMEVQYQVISEAATASAQTSANDWSGIDGALGRSLHAGSNLAIANENLASLTAAGVITNSGQLSTYESSWNTIQKSAFNHDAAQSAWAKLLQSGVADNAPNLAAFLKMWNDAAQNCSTIPINSLTLARQQGFAAASATTMARDAARLARDYAAAADMGIVTVSTTTGADGKPMEIKNPFKFAKGGIVRATPGGQQITVAEAGQDEAIIPLGPGTDISGMGPSTSARNGSGGDTVYIDLRNAQVWGTNDIDTIVAKIGTRLATTLLPNAAVKLSR